MVAAGGLTRPLSSPQVQGMSFIAAVLILNLDTADAFIAFSNLLNKPCQMAFFRVDHGLVSIPLGVWCPRCCVFTEQERLGPVRPEVSIPPFPFLPPWGYLEQVALYNVEDYRGIVLTLKNGRLLAICVNFKIHSSSKCLKINPWSERGGVPCTDVLALCQRQCSARSPTWRPGGRPVPCSCFGAMPWLVRWVFLQTL